MIPLTVAVIHREALAAEGIAAALARHSGVIPVAALTEPNDALILSDQLDAAAIDSTLPGAEDLATELRRKGVRVVVIGEDDAEGASVSPKSTVARLALALAPTSNGSRNGNGSPRLSPRENQVLNLISSGLTGKQIAKRLGISPKTVEHHKSRLYKKLGVPNQAAAVRTALANGALSGESWTQLNS